MECMHDPDILWYYRLVVLFRPLRSSSPQIDCLDESRLRISEVEFSATRSKAYVVMVELSSSLAEYVRSVTRLKGMAYDFAEYDFRMIVIFGSLHDCLS